MISEKIRAKDAKGDSGKLERPGEAARIEMERNGMGSKARASSTFSSEKASTGGRS